MLGSGKRGGDTYLGNQHEHDQRQAEVAAVDAPDGLEGDLVDRVAVVGPGVAESDVRETDAAPGEERGQAGQGEQPVEDFRATGIEVDVCEAAEEQNDANTPEGATRAVDVC